MFARGCATRMLPFAGGINGCANRWALQRQEACRGTGSRFSCILDAIGTIVMLCPQSARYKLANVELQRDACNVALL
jgi:hypothetical protein